jgi:hypothetical protein
MGAAAIIPDDYEIAIARRRNIQMGIRSARRSIDPKLTAYLRSELRIKLAINSTLPIGNPYGYEAAVW